MAARPTEGRVQAYLTSIDPVSGSEARPTEAQLRWAQFHSKSKARYTRSVIEALMQHPADVGDVVGAQDGDGNTTEESYSCSSSSSDGEGGIGLEREGGARTNPISARHASSAGANGNLFGDVDHYNDSAGEMSHMNGPAQQQQQAEPKKRRRRKKRKKKRRKGQPTISHGRRATLRVSERATHQRMQDIAKKGFRRRVVGGDFNASRNVFDSPTHTVPGSNASTPAMAKQTPPIPRNSGRGKGGGKEGADAGVAARDALAEAFGEEFFVADSDGGFGGGVSGPVSNSPFKTTSSSTAGGGAAASLSATRGLKTNQGRYQSESTARFTRDLNECDEERVRRFEQALSALKISTSAATDSNTVGKDGGRSTKRWTRPTTVGPGPGESPYFDIQRGGTYRYGAVHSPTNAPGGQGRGADNNTFDRGASWLIHMPKVEKSADRKPGFDAELRDKSASWLSHFPSAAPRYSVEKGRLIVSPTNSKGEQVDSPELQDRGATWMEHMPSKDDGFAAERAAAAASRSLKVDVTAEASRSPEKVLSPGEAKFNDIISQFHSIEAMLAAQREKDQLKKGEYVRGKKEYVAGTAGEPVVSPAMSQMHVLQASLAANKAAVADVGHERTQMDEDTLSPMSQFKAIQDKLRSSSAKVSGKDGQAEQDFDEPPTPKFGDGLSPMAQFNLIQDKLRSQRMTPEEDPDHDFRAFFSSSNKRGRDSLDPMANAVATSGAKAAGVKLPAGRESVSAEEANLLRHEGEFDVPEAPTPKYLGDAPKYPDAKPEFDEQVRQLAIMEGEDAANGTDMITQETGESRSSSAASRPSSEQENQQQGNVQGSEQRSVNTPSHALKHDSAPRDSAPRKGGVGLIRKMFSPGEKNKKGDQKTAEVAAVSAQDQDGPSPTEAAMHYGFMESPGGTPRSSVDPLGHAFSPPISEPSFADDKSHHSTNESHFSSSESHREASEFSTATEERMNEMKNIILTRGNQESGQVMIDTDGTTSDVSGTDDEYAKLRLGSLMLSPTIITKRYQQAVAAIEVRNWEQVTYLISANPWLAEMTDVRNDQYLLHKLALYGAGEGADDSDSVSPSARSATAAPEKLTLDLIEMCPAAVTKFDHEGNLPLHMSATSGNLEMIKQLGKRFSSGASVQNHEGMLPLHLAVLSCAYPSGAGGSSSPSGIVRAVIELFPGGIGVADNEGNLPLHVAAANLSGDLGVDVLFLLLDEGEKQAPNLCLRRHTRVKTMSSPDEEDAEDGAPDGTAIDGQDETPFCNLVKNKDGNTPLREAIETHAGWQIIEMLIQGGGGEEAALEPDKYDGQNALHLLIRGEYADPASVLSLLKIMPRIATCPDGEGVLPIEAACMASMPRAVVLALVLVDLPVDLDDKDAVKVREGHGASWSFLTCDCDDAHIDIVEEVLSICSYRQTRELCFLRSGGSTHNDGTVISRATPKAKAALRKALRFVGRYEFLGSSPVHSDAPEGLKVFEALDFGTYENPIQDGRAVLLKCFSKEEPYLNEISELKEIEFDTNCVEVVNFFCIRDFEAYSSANAPEQFCVAVEKPSLVLSRVVAGSDDYRQDPGRFHKYLTRVSMVLRLIGKSINHLHGHGLVHSNVSLPNCGKFGDKWKLMGLTGAKLFDEDVPTWSMGEGIPPEATELFPDKNGGLDEATVKLQETLKASTAIDAWAFGKLMYEVLVGEPLIPFDYSMDAFYNDRSALVALAAWDESTLRDVVNEVVESGAGTLAADLISHCLCPSPKDRPQSFDEILAHPFWKDQRSIRKGVKEKKKKQGVSKRRMFV